MNPVTYGSLVLATTALMGSSFSVGKIGLQFVSPLLLVGSRFSLAGILMAAVFRHRRKPDTWQGWMKIAVIGLFQTAGVMGLIFLSLRTITASESSILTFTNPLVVVVMATLILGARYRWVQWVGVTMGFVGVFVTLGLHLNLSAGSILALLGSMSWAGATLLIKRWGSVLDTWTLTAYQMLAGGLILLGASFTLEQPTILWRPETVLIILWLAIMASIVQFAVWFYLLKRGDPGKTSAFLFLAPFFGVLSGWAMLGEPLTRGVAIGGLLIAASLVLVNWQSGVPTRASAS